MSTRSKKTTVTTTTSRHSAASSASAGPSTPASQTGSRSPGRRPPSPTYLARQEEKDALAHLNNRLAAYIDKVRSLEEQNQYLSTKIRAYEDTTTRETSNLKALYEQELADARKNLDAIAKEKTRLEVEYSTFKADAGKWKDKYLKTKRDLEQAEKRLLSVEAQVNDLQARLNDAVNQRKHWENEYHRARSELDSVQKQLNLSQKQLEEESIKNVDLANQLQTLKEKLEFEQQIHSQELNETRTRQAIEIEEVDGVLQQEYDDKLQRALEMMREEASERIRVTREETETRFNRTINELTRPDPTLSPSSSQLDELRISRKRLDEYSSENTKLKSQLAAVEARISVLEAQLARQTDESESIISMRDSEIRRLRGQLAEQLTEYQDLMDLKLQLDNEIEAYRKLLESEELRLNIESPRRTSHASGSVSRKRKRVEMYSTSGIRQMRGASRFETTNETKGPIEVHEIDETGQYIKLFNNSLKDVSLAGYHLKHTAGEDETVYKFHRTVHVKPEGYVTVWSSDTDTHHAPPETLVMKGQRWSMAPSMKTVLLDKEGEEVSSRELGQRTESSTSYVLRDDDIDSGFERRSGLSPYRFSSQYRQDWGEAGVENGEKCVVM